MTGRIHTFLIAVSVLLGATAPGSEVGAEESEPAHSLEAASFNELSDGELLTEEELALYGAYSSEGEFETVVNAPRLPFSAGGEIVTSDTISRSHPDATDEVLSLVTGVKIIQHGAEGKGHQILMRGFDAAHGSDLEVRLMGVSMNEPSHVHGHGYIDLYGIIPETIGEMVVEKGPFLPWQGNFATGGSLDFELRVADDMRPGYMALQLDHRGRKRAVAIAAPKGVEENTFIAADMVDSNGYGQGRKSRRGALTASIGLDLGKGAAADFMLLAQAVRFDSPGALRLSDVAENKLDFWGAYSPYGQGQSDRVLAIAGVEHKNQKTTFDLDGYAAVRRFSLEDNFTGYLQNEQYGDRKRQTQRGQTAGLHLSLKHKTRSRFSSTLRFGTGWRYDGFHQEDVQITSDGTPWSVNRKLEAQIHHLHIYGGWRLRPAHWIRLLPSVRLDSAHFFLDDPLTQDEKADTKIAVSPRLCVTFPVHDVLSLFADYGRGYRPPEARAVMTSTPVTEDVTLTEYRGGVPDFVVADAVEAGLELNPSQPVTITLLGFGVWVNNEMIFDHVSNLTVAMDMTRRLGLELSASFSPFPWLQLMGNASYVDARFRESHNKVPGIPRWLAEARLMVGYETGPFGGLGVFAVGTRDLAHDATIGGDVRLDLDIGWRFDHVTVSLIGTNISNAKVVEGAYHYASWFDKFEPRSALPKIHTVAGEPLTVQLSIAVHL